MSKAANQWSCVAVLMGGVGSEREVSLESGRCVAEALRGVGVDVVEADVWPDKLDVLDDSRVDIFFPALHGQFGEDGRLQAIFEQRSLVYVGSGPEASRVAMDKVLSKRRFEQAGVPIAADSVFEKGGDVDTLRVRLAGFAGRYVVKPVCEGSSVGVFIADSIDEAVRAAGELADSYGRIMVEQYIEGREVTVSIVCGEAMDVIEIRPVQKFYDYNAKYVDDDTGFLFGTLDARLDRQVKEFALRCFDAVGCRHLGRVDFIIDDSGEVFALEINTLPGMTSHSLLPKAARKAGISEGGLYKKICDCAWAQRCG
jgi:D-alanine-D-alanine ligase